MWASGQVVEERRIGHAITGVEASMEKLEPWQCPEQAPLWRAFRCFVRRAARLQ
jgi:hypothetical protein